MPAPQFLNSLRPDNLPLCRCPIGRELSSKRILIIKLGGLGDVLMATPLAAALRAAFPECYLTWMVESANLGAIHANPYIDEIMVWDSEYWRSLLPRRWKKYFTKRTLFGLRYLWQSRKLRDALCHRNFDVLISFHPEQWPLLRHWTDVELAIGVFETEPRFRDSVQDYTPLYQKVYSWENLPLHRTDKYLVPLEALGVTATADKQMILGFTDDDVSTVNRFLEAHSVAPCERIIILAPMTSWESKNWPLDRYAALGDALAHSHNCRIIVVGSEQDRLSVIKVCDQMQSALRRSAYSPIAAPGTLSIQQLAALVTRSSLVISGDTGPMHMAAALDVPYLALFGATSPKRYAPCAAVGVTLQHTVPCGPCGWMNCENSKDNHLLCLRLITVAEAYEVASDLLRAPASA